MPNVNFTDFRQNLASHMDAVCDNAEPLLVTRKNGRSVVVVAETEFAAMTETLHLVANPRNRQNLLESIAQLDRGDTVAAALVDDGRD